MCIRYQPLPTLVKRLEGMQQHCRNVTKKYDRLKNKVHTIMESEAIIVDDQSNQDLQQVFICCF